MSFVADFINATEIMRKLGDLSPSAGRTAQSICQDVNSRTVAVAPPAKNKSKCCRCRHDGVEKNEKDKATAAVAETLDRKKATASCRGHASTFTSPHLVNTSTETGNKLYLTCTGEKQIGSSCSSDAGCLAMGTVCLLGVCQCRSNLFTDTWACDSKYLGCFKDSGTRVLPHPYSSQSMTQEVCTEYCSTEGYALAGTESGNQCYCGNSIPTGHTRDGENNCQRPCAGNTTLICGGTWYLSVYTT
ncbi:xylosyltransferase sqv-6-like [Haliotis cracherodii]|uniref:xylosyltransferase sqv-6-like n=1 Tax=Haliotis cracherodii TaxID=6455 RepID=UPI0039EB6844